MDRDFLFGATPDHVPAPLGARAYNRDRLLEQLADDPTRPRLDMNHHYDPRFRLRRLVWEVLDLNTGEPVASGRAWSRAAMFRRRHRAYRRVLAALTKARAESSCGRCRQPFDPSDEAFDGRARHRDTAFCRGCVDRCHESSDFAHECVICRAES